MFIEIVNFRSIREARFHASPIALITGRNTTGKTSICNGIAATLLGDPKVYGATQKDVSPVVTRGHEISGVTVSGEDWERSSTWPGDMMEDGVAPRCDEITLGRVNPASDYDAKQWASFVRRLAGDAGKVGWSDVEAASEIKSANPEDEAMLRDACRAGFDAAEKKAAETMTALKRQWAKITGESWGIRKAEGWWADDYRAGDDEVWEDKFPKTIKALEDELAVARNKAELFGQQTDNLEETLLELGGKSNQMRAGLESWNAEVKKLQSQLSAYPGSPPLCCPSCNAELELKSRVLSVHKPGDHVFGSAAHQKLQSHLEDARASYNDLAEQSRAVHAELKALQDVSSKIATLTNSARDPEIVEKELNDCRARLAAAEKTVAAAVITGRFKYFEEKHKLLSPSGLRLATTIKAIDVVQEKFHRVAGPIFPEHSVQIAAVEGGIDILFDGTTYRNMVWDGDPCSYALAIQIVFQILVAESYGEDAPILIDRFDTLERARRLAVLQYLARSERTAVICQTMDEAPSVDRLAKNGVGQTFWIDDGHVAELGDGE